MTGKGEATWYALITRYKCEKHVAAQLQRKGIEAYVPLLTRTKRYTRKIKTYHVPLISCYVFVRIDLRDRVRALEVPYVLDFVRFDGQISPVKEHEVNLLKRIVGEVDQLTAEPKTWLCGDRVEIISGSLTGIRGVLTERHGRHEFVVQLDTLGYQMCMTVDTRMLRRLDVLEEVG